jgi:hypothetical protein
MRSRWRRWLISLATVSFGGTAVVYLAVVLLDPFATGRITPFAHFNVTTDVRIFAHAGRVRNPEFDSAIIGNSRGFAIEPARLSEGTKRRFVHLALDAAFPGDQLKMLALFATHRTGAAPLLLQVVDYESWCNTARGKTSYQMPWWLYEGSNFDYLRRIMTADSLLAASRRAKIAAGFAGDFRRRDGYELWLPKNTEQLRRALGREVQPTGAPPADAPLPELDDLAQSLRQLEPDSSVVLFMPPVFAAALPVAGSPAEARVNACKQRLALIASQRPNTAFVDARRDSPPVRDAMNFIDATHYLDAVAIPAEAELISAINRFGGDRNR